jgi:hypothetical protein
MAPADPIARDLAVLRGRLVKVLARDGGPPEGPYRIRAARVDRGVVLLEVETPGGCVEVRADDCLMRGFP